ncbi:MAG: DNA methyltransferase, partial [Bacteroidales bacterium]|nr:DNA methyltransferase [Bacteroidales bacterium]
IILASTKPNAWILDPFTGSSTTGIAANLFNRKFLGIDKEREYLEISRNRKIEIENKSIFRLYRNKINGIKLSPSTQLNIVQDSDTNYSIDLPF